MPLAHLFLHLPCLSTSIFYHLFFNSGSIILLYLCPSHTSKFYHFFFTYLLEYLYKGKLCLIYYYGYSLIQTDTGLISSKTPVKDEVRVKVTQLCPTPATPWTVACQAPLSMEFSRQEYWGGLPFTGS